MSSKDSLNFLLAQVIRLHHYRFQMLLGELGIHQGQPPILFLLWKKDGRSHKELADTLGLKPATITIMINRMEKSGWLQRRPDPEDMRVSRVYLTEKAKKVRPKVEEVLYIMEKECLNGFTNKEKILLRGFLVQMQENLNRACRKKTLFQ